MLGIITLILLKLYLCFLDSLVIIFSSSGVIFESYFVIVVVVWLYVMMMMVMMMMMMMMMMIIMIHRHTHTQTNYL